MIGIRTNLANSALMLPSLVIFIYKHTLNREGNFWGIDFAIHPVFVGFISKLVQNGKRKNQFLAGWLRNG